MIFDKSHRFTVVIKYEFAFMNKMYRAYASRDSHNNVYHYQYQFPTVMYQCVSRRRWTTKSMYDEF